MKLNLLNKIYILISLYMIGLIIYQTLHFQAWNRYYYDATVIAPETYPVSVRECQLITADDDDFAYAQTESVNKNTSSWEGAGDYLKLRDKMRLPEKLAIAYYSFRGKNFYKDTIALPTKRIQEIFERAIRNKNTEKYYSYQNKIKGLSFIIGLANDGQLLVWMRGINLEELILKKKLTPTYAKPEDRYYEKELTNEAYFEHAFQNLSDSLKTKINEGFDANANYADSAPHYIDKNKELWKYQKENGIIEREE